MPIAPSIPTVGTVAGAGLGGKLGQVFPGDTNLTSIGEFWPGETIEATWLLIVNSTGTARTAKIYYVNSPDAPTAANSICYDISVPANDVVSFNPEGGLAVIGGLTRILVSASAASSLSFSLFGNKQVIQ